MTSTPSNDYSEDGHLQIAYSFAKQVSDVLNEKYGKRSISESFLTDLSDVILAAIECMKTNEPIPKSLFSKISSYVSRESKPPLMMLGFSISVLLEKMFIDRSKTAEILAQVGSRKDASIAVEKVPVEIKEEPLEDLESEIKEEPLEELDTVVKEEPQYDDESAPYYETDEYCLEDLEDGIKPEEPEEKPVADIYYPATGFSRQHGSTSGFTNYDMEEEEYEVPGPSSQPYQDDRPDASVGVQGLQRSGPVVIRQRPISEINKTFGKVSGQSYKTRKCYLCGKSVNDYYLLPGTLSELLRLMDRLVFHSLSDRIRVGSATIGGKHRPCICKAHVKQEKPEENLRKPVELIAKKLVLSKTKCDLCTMPEFPCKLIPKGAKAKAFLDRMHLSVHQHETINPFLSDTSKRHASICRRHFKRPAVQFLEATNRFQRQRLLGNRPSFAR